MNAYHDPLGRVPKGHLHISTQPPPPHPNSSADETTFRPTSDCSQPMFPDASFDVSTNKSTTTGSHRRPLLSPHMNPPPLPPNAPSMYSRSLQPPVPTSVHKNERWDDSGVPPSPLQIINSRHSASSSRPREAREPHSDGFYPSTTSRLRNDDQELRQPPPLSPNDGYYSYSHDVYRHSSNDSYPYDHRANHQHFNGRDHTVRYDNMNNPNLDQDASNRINEDQNYCICYKCNNIRQQPKDAYKINGTGTNMHPQIHMIHGQFPNQSIQYIRHERQQPPSSYCRHIEEDNRLERSDYDADASDGRIHERSHHNMHHQPRYQPPDSPLSPLTYEDRAHLNHGWSPRSDNAILHAVQYYEERLMGDNKYPCDCAPSNPIKRVDYEESHGRREPIQSEYHKTEKLSYPVDHYSAEVPTHVSYQTPESRHERHYSNASPDRRDDYSGSTIPTFSTETPKRASQFTQQQAASRRAHHPPQQYFSQEPARPQLRIDIPNAQYYPSPQNSHHPAAKTSRSNGRSETSYQQPPHTSRSEPAMYQRAQSRAENAEKEREKSEARHQILKEIHQATNMRKSALDDNDRSFWDRQIATLNESFKKL